MTPLNSTIFTLFLAGLLFVLFFTSRTPAKLGQVISEPFFCINGICTWSYRLEMRGSTSTPCSVRSPEATSTLIHASTVLDLPATSTLSMEMGIADNNNATTSRIFATSTVANAKGSVAATSTLNTIISPKSYVNLRFGTPAGISKGSAGSCEIMFRVL